MRYEDPLEEALRLEIRKKIYDTIKENPGLHFREIQRRTGIATGALQYHLDYLAKRHLIKTERESKFLRYYLIREKFEETNTMGFLRQDNARKILIFLCGKKYSSIAPIAKETGLNKATLEKHLENMILAGLVQKNIRGKTNYYSVMEKEKIIGLLKSYRKSFLDQLVDDFVEVWSEI